MSSMFGPRIEPSGRKKQQKRDSVAKDEFRFSLIVPVHHFVSGG
jgi:hypothetical protein